MKDSSGLSESQTFKYQDSLNTYSLIKSIFTAVSSAVPHMFRPLKKTVLLPRKDTVLLLSKSSIT